MLRLGHEHFLFHVQPSLLDLSRRLMRPLLLLEQLLLQIPHFYEQHQRFYEQHQRFYEQPQLLI